jgi:uncharacterized delta-60 repeat protein
VGVACVIAAAVSLLATPAVAVPRLDARFGDGGIARVPFKFRVFREFGGTLRPVRQADGKVLVAAQLIGDRNSEEFVLARFGRAGALDTTFGRRGRVRIDFPWQFQPLTVLAQRDGRIVLVGTVGGYAYFAGGPSQLGIVTLLPDGSRDRSFGTDGFVVWNPPWRTPNEWTTPGLAVRQPDGRLLVAASVEDPRLQGSPAQWQRVVVARFQPDGSLDQSFGQGGFAELDSDAGYVGPWARLADGRLASIVFRHEGPGEPTRETQAWWLHSFAADGSDAAALRLGLDVVDDLVELVPTRDGGLLMIGDRGPGPALRRILPDGSLDATFGRSCAQPLLRAGSPRGGAPTPDGGVFVTTRDSFAIPYDATGCIAARPLRLGGVSPGPPLLQRGRSALVGATFNDNQGLAGGLALIKIRR